MSSSRIHFRNCYIDTSDAAMAVWLRLMVSVIDELPAPAPWLLAARADWDETATMGASFGVIPELDSFLETEEHRKILLEICGEATRRLCAMGDPIPVATLNALGVGPAGARFEQEVPTAVFRDVATQFTHLVRSTPLE
jgi:hypothetical protein